jgi:hypothetical protein
MRAAALIFVMALMIIGFKATSRASLPVSVVFNGPARARVPAIVGTTSASIPINTGPLVATWRTRPAPGDLLFACVNGQYAEQFVVPTGWNQLFQDSTADFASGIFWRDAGPAESKAVSWAFVSADTGKHLAVSMLDIRGAAAGAPQWSAAETSSAIGTTTGIVPTAVFALPLACFTSEQSVTAFSAVLGWANIVHSSLNHATYANAIQARAQWATNTTSAISTASNITGTNTTVNSYGVIVDPGTPAPLLGIVTETPAWSNDFVESIGINTHCGLNGIGWADCANGQRDSNIINTLGVRHIRDGLSSYWNGGSLGLPNCTLTYGGGRVSTNNCFSYWTSQNAALDFDFVIGLNYGYYSAYVADSLALVPQITGMEIGGNEPNASVDVCATPNPNGYSCWMTDQNTQVKQGFQTDLPAHSISRVGPSILYNPANTYVCSNLATNPPTIRVGATQCPTNGIQDLTAASSYYGAYTSYLDFTNMHSYQGAGNPGASSLASYISTETTYAVKPLWITENGYGSPPGGDGLSNATISKYEPRIFAEDFYEGVKRTYQFTLMDEPSAAAGTYFYTFGLLSSTGTNPNYTLTPKLQFESLRSLIQIESDAGTRPTLVPVTYSIVPQAAGTVHHVLTQRQDGSYQLAIWNEVADSGLIQSVPVTVTFVTPAAISAATTSMFTPATGQFSLSTLPISLVGGRPTLTLTVSDQLQIVHFAATGTVTDPTPLPTATAFAYSQTNTTSPTPVPVVSPTPL